MALATGTGVEVQRPLATVVISGLITSDALTSSLRRRETDHGAHCHRQRRRPSTDGAAMADCPPLSACPGSVRGMA
ncbi:hypothetical protein UAA55_01205 [Nitrospirillum sp. BR 11163]|nr:hypothetical protein [Nitrospirillum sp. BR 11163]MEA1672012.1 hypothetical protein [Nitrospirillum sp. BR 11163]